MPSWGSGRLAVAANCNATEGCVYGLHLLGGLSLHGPDGPIKARSGSQRRPLALLALLAIAGEDGLTRDRLIGLLWPEMDEPRARHNLSDVAHNIRHDLGPECLLTRGDVLWLAQTCVTADVVQFEEALARADLESASRLYRGPFLDGFHLGAGAAFDQWVERERQRLAARCADALDALARASAEAGDFDAAVAWWQQRLLHNPYCSHAAVGLLDALAARGDRADAIRSAEAHVHRLRRELGVEPDSNVLHAVERLRRAEPHRDPSSRPLTTPQEPVQGTAPADDDRLTRRARRVRRAVAGTGTVLVIAVGTAVIVRAVRDVPPLDPNALAVAPFQLLGAGIEPFWAEGAAELVALKLDGAGPLSAASIETVARHSKSARGRHAARRLGIRLGAGLVFTAAIVASGPDSLKVDGTLHDVSTRRVLMEISLYSDRDRLDHVANELALAIMTAIAADRPLGAWRLSSVGSTAATAVRAYLEAEYHFRRFQLDSARRAYERAIAIDSTFALAYRGLSEVESWGAHDLGHSSGHSLRAGALNRGLARRESLLIVADSVRAALEEPGDLPALEPLRQRLFSTVDAVRKAYPTDPDAWFRYGDAKFHCGVTADATGEESRDAFSRALTLDPSFAPPYIHLIELDFMQPGEHAARSGLEQFLDLRSSGTWADAVHLLADLLSPAAERRANGARRLDSLTTIAGARLPSPFADGDATLTLHVAAHLAERGVDSGEIGLRLYRRWGWAPGHALEAAYRGHLAEAVAVLYANQRPEVTWPFDPRILLARLAVVGGLAPDTAAQLFAGMLARGDSLVIRALPWFAERGDSASLRRAVALLTASADSSHRPRARYAREAVRGYLLLLQGDTVGGAEVLAALPPWCYGFACYQEQVAAARALARAGHVSAAAGVFDRLQVPLDRVLPPDYPLVVLEHARVRDHLGERDRAATLFRYVAAVWQHADPTLQPYVIEARKALARLSAETPPAAPRPR
ncbi:MAG: hypothetical protein OER21_00460 [Gemmatimonadota bacterium]|nr:hypothetical protein [Gemmatimonadota bacterium]